MPPFRYMMISIVACEAGFLPEAAEHLRGVMGELSDALPDVTAYFGTYVAGRQSGSLALIHLYRELGDVEPAFGVYASSPNFAAAAASGKIALRERNLVRLSDAIEPVRDISHELEVHTRHPAPGLSAATLADLPSGSFRHGTLWTGSHAGQHLLVTQGDENLQPHHGAERDVLRIVG